MTKKIIHIAFLSIALLLLTHLQKAVAQDIHFSQNFATPLILNPAMTGVMPGDFRVTANYRNQWSSIMSTVPFRTIAASADAAFSGFGQKDRLGVGLVLYSDKGGDLDFSTNYVDVNLAYNVGFSENGYLSLGVAGGVQQKSFDPTNAQFGNQFDGIQFNEEILSEEFFETTGRWSANFGGGAMFYLAYDNRTNIYAGAAAYHLITPNFSFTGEEIDKWRAKLSVQAGGSKGLGDHIDIVPSFYYIKQGPHHKLDAGSFVRYIFSHDRRTGLDKAFNIGAWIRLVGGIDGFATDALALVAKMDYDNFSVGVSYDVTISDLAVANANRGGVEVSLVYIAKRPESRAKPLYCPRF